MGKGRGFVVREPGQMNPWISLDNLIKPKRLPDDTFHHFLDSL